MEDIRRRKKSVAVHYRSNVYIEAKQRILLLAQIKYLFG